MLTNRTGACTANRRPDLRRREDARPGTPSWCEGNRRSRSAGCRAPAPSTRRAGQRRLPHAERVGRPHRWRRGDIVQVPDPHGRRGAARCDVGDRRRLRFQVVTQGAEKAAYAARPDLLTASPLPQVENGVVQDSRLHRGRGVCPSTTALEASGGQRDHGGKVAAGQRTHDGDAIRIHAELVPVRAHPPHLALRVLERRRPSRFARESVLDRRADIARRRDGMGMAAQVVGMPPAPTAAMEEDDARSTAGWPASVRGKLERASHRPCRRRHSDATRTRAVPQAEAPAAS